MVKPNPKWSAKEGDHTIRHRDGKVWYENPVTVMWHDGQDYEDHPTDEPGWYWATCCPGCLPDSDWFGPFTSSSAALRDAKDY